MPTSFELAKIYREANAPQPVDPTDLGLQALQELVALLFAAGVPSDKMTKIYYAALMAGIDHWHAHSLTHIPAKMAQVDLALRTWRGLVSISDAQHEKNLGSALNAEQQ